MVFTMVLGDIPENTANKQTKKKTPKNTFFLEYSTIIWKTNLCQMSFDVL